MIPVKLLSMSLTKATGGLQGDKVNTLEHALVKYLFLIISTAFLLKSNEFGGAACHDTAKGLALSGNMCAETCICIGVVTTAFPDQGGMQHSRLTVHPFFCITIFYLPSTTYGPTRMWQSDKRLCDCLQMGPSVFVLFLSSPMAYICTLNP